MGFLRVVTPLMNLWKDEPWQWANRCGEALNKIKTAITMENPLKLPNLAIFLYCTWMSTVRLWEEYSARRVT